MIRPGLTFILVAVLTGCSKFDLLNATIPACGYTVTRDVAYAPMSRQKLDVYRPDSTDSARPVVVFFYGGYWQYGSKSDYRFAAQALASRGFVAVLPDYRLYPEVTFPAFVEDGARAVRWVHDHVAEFGGDPARIHLMGHSAGAHLAALLTLDGHYLKDVGLDRSVIRSTAALSGPYDFRPDPTSRGPFNMGDGDEAADSKTQPITFADGTAPPMLLIHGMKDEVVRPENAVRLYDKLRAAGASATLILYPDRGHPSVVMALAWPFRWLAPTLRDVTEFFGRD